MGLLAPLEGEGDESAKTTNHRDTDYEGCKCEHLNFLLLGV